MEPVLLDHLLEKFLAFHKVTIVVLVESDPRVLLLVIAAPSLIVVWGLAWLGLGGVEDVADFWEEGEVGRVVENVSLEISAVELAFFRHLESCLLEILLADLGY